MRLAISDGSVRKLHCQLKMVHRGNIGHILKDQGTTVDRDAIVP